MARPDLPSGEPDTVVVHIPIVFTRRGGRKALIVPDGSPAPTRVCPQANNALIIALARAFRWRKQLEAGVYATVAEIAAAEGINDSYASRVLRLTLLAPDIVEGILNDTRVGAADLQRMLRPFPVEWASQRFPLRITTNFALQQQGAVQERCGRAQSNPLLQARLRTGRRPDQIVALASFQSSSRFGSPRKPGLLK